MIQVRLIKCKPTETRTCAPDDEIVQFMSSLDVSIMYIEQYFDMESFGAKSIKFKMSERYFSVLGTVKQAENQFISFNEVILQDAALGIGGEERFDYLKLGKSHYYLESIQNSAADTGELL